MKYVVKNVHRKAVMLPGGMLPPGNTRTLDLSEEMAKMVIASEFLEASKVIKKKAKKK